jgi:hypothetical protein
MGGRIGRGLGIAVDIGDQREDDDGTGDREMAEAECEGGVHDRDEG